MAFVAENPLEEALAQAAVDVLARPRFYQALMSEPLVVAGEIVRKAPDAPPEGMNLAMIRLNGRVFHPVFTSLGRLKKIAPDEQRHFLAIGREFFQRTLGGNFLLNPNSELSKGLLASEIAFWLDPSARARRTLERNPPRATFTLPAERPRMLVDALRILFANRKSAVSAHLLEVWFSDRNEPPHPLIVIETDDQFEKLAAEVSQLAQAVSPETIIDIIPLDRKSIDPGLAGSLEQSPPFYQRPYQE